MSTATMFALSQHHPYAYAAQPAPAPTRQYSNHSTSSAFSSSANPDEDWTKISDLAERRRVQNRIAQRNYRKKLKKRLEELERRAGTSDGASSSSGNEKPSPPAKAKRTQTAKTPRQTPPAPRKPAVQGQYTPPMHHEDDYLFTPSYDERERSLTPPMFAAYSTYPPPPPEDMMMSHYGPVHGYRPMPLTDSYAEYLSPSPVPVTLPSVTHFTDAIKREPGGYPSGGPPPLAAEDGAGITYMSYHGYPVPGVDMAGTGAHHHHHHHHHQHQHQHHPSPYDQMPHTPPLSNSFEHSAACSESGSYDYPTTPLSMPASPELVH